MMDLKLWNKVDKKFLIPNLRSILKGMIALIAE